MTDSFMSGAFATALFIWWTWIWFSIGYKHRKEEETAAMKDKERP